MKIDFKYEFKDMYGTLTNEVHHTCHTSDICQIVDDFKCFLLAIGFQPETVNSHFAEEE